MPFRLNAVHKDLPANDTMAILDGSAFTLNGIGQEVAYHNCQIINTIDLKEYNHDKPKIIAVCSDIEKLILNKQEPEIQDLKHYTSQILFNTISGIRTSEVFNPIASGIASEINRHIKIDDFIHKTFFTSENANDASSKTHKRASARGKRAWGKTGSEKTGSEKTEEGKRAKSGGARAEAGHDNANHDSVNVNGGGDKENTDDGRTSDATNKEKISKNNAGLGCQHARNTGIDPSKWSKWEKAAFILGAGLLAGAGSSESQEGLDPDAACSASAGIIDAIHEIRKGNDDAAADKK